MEPRVIAEETYGQAGEAAPSLYGHLFTKPLGTEGPLPALFSRGPVRSDACASCRLATADLGGQ